jgi:adenylate cyclase
MVLQLLEHLDEYLEVIVEAVRAEGGDVLKFIGDGVLSIFPVEAGGREEACARARRALEQALMKAADIDDLRFVGCLHIGPVTYGNIGSADRLDFTVVGPTVNLISRLEAVAKRMNQIAVCSREVAGFFPADTIRSLGSFALQGIPNEQTIFGLVLPHAQADE